MVQPEERLPGQLILIVKIAMLVQMHRQMVLQSVLMLSVLVGLLILIIVRLDYMRAIQLLMDNGQIYNNMYAIRGG